MIAKAPTIPELGALLGLGPDSPTMRRVLGSLSIALPLGEESAYLEFKEIGVSVAFQEESFAAAGDGSYLAEGKFVVIGVHLYSEGLDEYSEYPGSLPGDIRFGDTRDEIEQKLGPASAKGGGTQGFGQWKAWPLWDRFDGESYSLHVQYSAKNRVELLTLCRPRS
jgi:hypothetical protein